MPIDSLDIAAFYTQRPVKDEIALAINDSVKNRQELIAFIVVLLGNPIVIWKIEFPSCDVNRASVMIDDLDLNFGEPIFGPRRLEKADHRRLLSEHGVGLASGLASS